MKKSTLHILLLLLSLPLFAQESDDAILSAAKAVASGNASKKDEAIAFKNNKTINAWGMSGRIDNDTYQKNQSVFDRKNREICANSAAESGLESGAQKKSSKDFKPGTDTDAILNSSGDKQISSQDVKNTRDAYNRNVDKYLKDSGVESAKDSNWAGKLDTDIMPDPSKMSPEEFKKSAEIINGDGGNMYKDPAAAKVEAAKRSGSNIDLGDSKSYIDEMQGKVDSMKKQVESIRKNPSSVQNPDQEIQKLNSHIAKYTQRVNEVSDYVASQESVNTKSQTDSKISKAQQRTADTRYDAAAVGAMDKHYMNKALENYTNTIASVGEKDKGAAAKCQEVLLKMGDKMSPQQRQDMLDKMRESGNSKMAEELTRKFQKKTTASDSRTKAPQNNGESTLKVLGVGGAVVGSYMEELEKARTEKRDVNYGKVAMDSAIAVSPLGKYVNAAKGIGAEMDNVAKYRTSMEEKYRQIGYDMDDPKTKFRIWASSTAYGTARGVWYGVHMVPGVGDVLSGAESIGALSYESVMLVKDVNESRRIIEENKTAQDETAERALANAWKYLADMKKLAAYTDLLASKLDSQTNWARQAADSYIDWKLKLESMNADMRAMTDSVNSLLKDAESAVSKDSTDKLGTEFAAILAMAKSHKFSAGKLLEKLKENSDDADSKKEAVQLIGDFGDNLQRFTDASERLAALAGLASSAALSADINELLSSRQEAFDNLNLLKKMIKPVPESFKSEAKNLADAVTAFNLLKGSLKRAYDRFWVNDDKGSADWERVWQEANTLKISKPSQDSIRRNYEHMKTFGDSIEKFTRDFKMIESPAAVKNLATIEKDAKEKLLLLAPKASSAEKALEEAKAAIDQLSSLIGAGGADFEIVVSDSQTGSPVFGAVITISSGKKQFAEERSGLSGNAVLKNLEKGNYSLKIVADNYAVLTQNFSFDGKNGRLELRLNPTLKATVQTPENKPEITQKNPEKTVTVDDASLKRFESFFRDLERYAESGTFVSPDNMTNEFSPFMNAFTNIPDSIRFGAEVFAAYLHYDRSTARTLLGAYYSYQLLAAQSVFTEKTMDFRLMNSAFPALMLADIASNSETSSLAASSGDASRYVTFLVDFTRQFSFHFSNMKYWEAYVKAQEATRKVPRDGAFWYKLIISGSGAGFSKELDLPWTQIEKDAKAAKDTVVISESMKRDYRNKYAVETILPLIKKYLDAEMLASRSSLASLTDNFIERVKNTQVQIKGNVRTYPLQRSFGLRVEGFAKEPKMSSCADSFSVSIPVKDIVNNGTYNFETSLRYEINNDPKLSTTICGGIYRRCKLNVKAPYLSLQGGSFVFTVPDYNCVVTELFETRPFKDSDGMLEVPKYPQNRMSEFNSALSSIFAQAAKLSEDELTLKMEEKLDEARSINSNDMRSFDRIMNILSHNSDVLRRSSNSSHDSAARKSAEEEKKRRDREYEDMNRSWRAKLNEFKQSVYQKNSALSKDFDILNKDAGKLCDEYYKTFNEYSKLADSFLSLKKRLSSSRRFDKYPNWNPELIDTYFDKDFKAILNSDPAKLTAIMQKLDAQSAQAAEFMKRFENYKDSSLSWSASREYRVNELRKILLTVAMLKSADMQSVFASGLSEISGYMAKRGLSVKSLDARLAEFESLLTQLPSQQDIANASSILDAVVNDAGNYRKAFNLAMLSGNAQDLKIDKALLDAKGSDSVFIAKVENAFNEALAKYPGVVRNFTVDKNEDPVALVKAMKLQMELPCAEMSSEQSQRYSQIIQKLVPVMQSIYNEKLYCIYDKAFFDFIADKGKNPAERLNAVLKKNVELKAELLKRKGNLPSADSADIGKFFQELKNNYGILPADMQNLENLKIASELTGEVYKSGRLAECRKLESRPPAPQTVSVNGSDYPLYGVIVLRYSQVPDISEQMAKSYENTPYKGKFRKALKIKYASSTTYNVLMAYDPSQFSALYDSSIVYEMPISTEYLPMRLGIYSAFEDKNTKASSYISGEPGLIIVIIP